MAKKQIIWASRAQQDRLKILEYWLNRNKSINYSKKLYALINSATEILSVYPEIGKPTEIENVRVKIVRDYLIIYETKKDRIEILTISDSRQDPRKLNKLVKGENQ